MSNWEILRHQPSISCRKINDITYLMVRKFGYHIVYAVVDLSAYNKNDIATVALSNFSLDKWQLLSNEEKLKVCACGIFTNTIYKDDYFFQAGKDMSYEEVKENLDKYVDAFLINSPVIERTG